MAKKNQSTKRPRGRPSKFTQEIAEEICERLSRGEPLAVICRDEKMPGTTAVWEWTQKDAKFSESIARARVEGYDALAAQCMEIADNEEHDWKMTKKGVITNEVAIGRARLQVETRLKLLAKWDPKRYGDKLDLNANFSGDIKVVIGGDA